MFELVTANECRKLVKDASSVEKLVASELVVRFDSAIRKVAQSGEHKMAVVIPVYKYGVPSYDRADVENRVRAIFSNAGFNVRTLDEEKCTFEVSWEVQENEQDVSETSKQVLM
jgi:hypothetical protein